MPAVIRGASKRILASIVCGVCVGENVRDSNKPRALPTTMTYMSHFHDAGA